MGKHVISLHPVRGKEVIPLDLLDSSYMFDEDTSCCCPLMHPGPIGEHHQVGEDQSLHVTIIPPGG